MSLSPISSHGGVSLASVTLTDAQIKALPTTPVVIIPATETPNYAANLTKVPVILGGAMVASDYAVGYTNVDPSAYLFCALGTDGAPFSVRYPQSPWLSAGDALAEITPGLLNTDGSNHVISGKAAFDGNFYDNAIRIQANNLGSGVLTAGDPGNTLRVTLLYVVVAVA